MSEGNKVHKKPDYVKEGIDFVIVQALLAVFFLGGIAFMTSEDALLGKAIGTGVALVAFVLCQTIAVGFVLTRLDKERRSS